VGADGRTEHAKIRNVRDEGPACASEGLGQKSISIKLARGPKPRLWADRRFRSGRDFAELREAGKSSPHRGIEFSVAQNSKGAGSRSFRSRRCRNPINISRQRLVGLLRG